MLSNLCPIGTYLERFHLEQADGTACRCGSPPESRNHIISYYPLYNDAVISRLGVELTWGTYYPPSRLWRILEGDLKAMGSCATYSGRQMTCTMSKKNCLTKTENATDENEQSIIERNVHEEEGEWRECTRGSVQFAVILCGLFVSLAFTDGIIMDRISLICASNKKILIIFKQ